MNSNGILSSSAAAAALAGFEAERDQLRTECSTLFDRKREIEMQVATLLDQKKAIEMQMSENQTRLQWLDDKIDGTGVGDGLASRHGETTTTATARVKFEVVDEHSNGKEKSNWGNNNSLSMTQPEEYLTDPHTQLFDENSDSLKHPSTLDNMGGDDGNSQDNYCGVNMAEEFRRISTSPPLQMVHSNTPPGLKPSGKAKTAVVNPYAAASATAGGNITATRGANANPTNPYLDLWNPSKTTTHRNTLNDSGNYEPKRGNGVNTLEKYFDGTTMPHNSYETSQVMNNTTTTLNQRQSTNDHRNNPPTNPARQQYPWSERMMHHLRKTFGIENFRGHQEEIINVTMQGKDAFVVMRTGGEFLLLRNTIS